MYFFHRHVNTIEQKFKQDSIALETQARMTQLLLHFATLLSIEEQGSIQRLELRLQARSAPIELQTGNPVR